MDSGKDRKGGRVLRCNGEKRESKDLKLLMGKGEGWSEQACRTVGGRVVWAEALLNEEAAEPFLLLSNCMLLCLCSREGERAR